MNARHVGKLLVLGLGLALPAAAQNGIISGRVTSAATGAPLPGVEVTACSRVYETTWCRAPAVTNAGGVYAISVPADTYYAYTTNSFDYVDEIFGNIPCVFSCSEWTIVDVGTPIVVNAGTTASGRDFALEPGGVVTGTVRDAVTGAPLAGTVVSILPIPRPSRYVGQSATTGADGRYVLRGLATASYQLHTWNNAGYTNEFYDNFLCRLTCSPGDIEGTPVAVTTRTVTTGIDFGLDLGGRITGTVTDARTGTPVSEGSVNLENEFGDDLGYFPIDARGVYTAIGLPAGRYFLGTMTDHADEVYDNVPWLGSYAAYNMHELGTPVLVSLRATTTANFALEPGGTISGTITRSDTGAPVSGCLEAFVPVGQDLVLAARACTDATGGYQVEGLHPGTYFVVTPGYDLIRELYDDIPCPGRSCEIASGTPIVVAVGATTSGIDFVLDLGGRISGTVTNAGSSAPLDTVEVFVFGRSGGSAVQVGEGETDYDGSYVVEGLPSGTYYAFSKRGSYLNEIYDDIPCPGGQCSADLVATLGTPIAVTAGGETAAIDFALTPRVETDPPDAPSDFNVVVDAYTALLTWWPAWGGAAARGYVLEAGPAPGTTTASVSMAAAYPYSYRVSGVAPGRYYVRVSGWNGVGVGPPSVEREVVVYTDGSGRLEAPPELAAWMSGRRLTLTWGAPPSGGIPTGYIVEAGTAAGLRNIGSVFTTAQAFTYEVVPDGYYFLRVRAMRPGETGPPSREIMLTVGSVPSPPGAPADLTFTVSGTTVDLDWTAPADGAPTSYVIEAGSAPGRPDLLVMNTGTADTAISFAGVPPGTYFVRIRAANALGAGVASNEVVVVVP